MHEQPMRNRIIGEKYRIESLIKKGGMGRVYRATHLIFEELHALKMLHPSLVEDPDTRRRFFREAHLTRKASQRSAHIVAIHDFGFEPELGHYLSMEYLDGAPLSDYCKSLELSIPELLDIATQVCEGMEAAHQLGILHRDLKPENIVLSRRQDGGYLAKIIDFGIAHPVAGMREEFTRLGSVVGTPNYMAPEQIMLPDERAALGWKLDARADIYALGVTLFKALTGAAPFRSPSRDGMGQLLGPDERVLEVWRQHVECAPTAPHLVLPSREIPLQVSELVLRAMEKSPDARFPSMQAFGAAIQEVTEALQRPTPAPLPPQKLPQKTLDLRPLPCAEENATGDSRAAPHLGGVGILPDVHKTIEDSSFDLSKAFGPQPQRPQREELSRILQAETLHLQHTLPPGSGPPRLIATREEPAAPQRETSSPWPEAPAAPRPPKPLWFGISFVMGMLLSGLALYGLISGAKKAPEQLPPVERLASKESRPTLPRTIQAPTPRPPKLPKLQKSSHKLRRRRRARRRARRSRRKAARRSRHPRGCSPPRRRSLRTLRLRSRGLPLRYIAIYAKGKPIKATRRGCLSIPMRTRTLVLVAKVNPTGYYPCSLELRRRKHTLRFRLIPSDQLRPLSRDCSLSR